MMTLGFGPADNMLHFSFFHASLVLCSKSSEEGLNPGLGEDVGIPGRLKPGRRRMLVSLAVSLGRLFFFLPLSDGPPTPAGKFLPNPVGHWNPGRVVSRGCESSNPRPSLSRPP